ncbi:MAG: hypothetical protein ACYC33_04385 [Thermoleophilia bacterium]
MSTISVGSWVTLAEVPVVSALVFPSPQPVRPNRRAGSKERNATHIAADRNATHIAADRNAALLTGVKQFCTVAPAVELK